MREECQRLEYRLHSGELAGCKSFPQAGGRKDAITEVPTRRNFPWHLR